MNTLRDRLTSERLSTYDLLTAGGHAETLVLYEWNTAVSAAIYGSLQAFEVVLRNALDQGLRHWHSSHERLGHWYDDPTRVLDSRRHRDIARAQERLWMNRRTVTPGRIVAELNLGFYLAGDYADLLFVGAICPRARARVDQTSTVDLVLAQRPALVSPN